MPGATSSARAGSSFAIHHGQDLRLPFITARIHIFRVNAFIGMNEPRIDIFEMIGFFAYVFDLIDANVSTLK
jgi:hypothetical protein